MVMAKKKTIRTIPQQRTPVREQDAAERAHNFAEVNLGYNEAEALVEADRCLFCPDPACIAGCPVGIDIPAFIERIAAKDFRGAYDAIGRTNLLPAVCGRVCPQETQCEGTCIVGETLEPVAIGRLERFVGDRAIAEGWANLPHIEPNGRRVGIVGSGPAGMACAADMAKAGCEVTVFEAFHEPGGVLRYGIPDFRLPNEVIDAEIANLRRLGVKFQCNTLVGRLFTIGQMVGEMGFDAVFIGTGAGYPAMLGVPGDSLNGVLSANELLTRCNLMRARDFPNYDTPIPLGRNIAVVGAGNTAMDAMRVSLRLGRRTSLASIAAARRNARPAPRKCITPRKKAWCSSGSPRRWRCSATTRATCAACAASRCSLASPTSPAAPARCRSPAASTRWSATRWCSPSAPTPTRSSARPRGCGWTSAATSRPTTTWRPRWPGCTPAATSSPARPPSSRRWAPAARRHASMKAYLGIGEPSAEAPTIFGIQASERIFARIRDALMRHMVGRISPASP